MSLYEKIGRLIKQNKLYQIYNSNSSNDSSIENIISDLLLSNKIESKNVISSNIIDEKKIITINELKETQNLIKNCTKEEQLILIAILEIQLSLIGNENNYIKYEKINEKIIEKNIYWVITKEIHKNIHKEKTENEFEEYCHCVHDQKEKYILGTENNFKYDNIDSIICQLKNTNKNIEFIAIKTIFISFYNISCEYIQKYMEINEYIKKNNYYEYLIFDYIINDFIYINNQLNFIEIDFKQSLNNFNKEFNINISIHDLFKDIFFNAIFHNHVLGCLYIHGFIRNNNNTKSSLIQILNLINKQNIPLNKNVSKLLNIEILFNFKIDLTSKILEKCEQLQICVGIRSIEKEYIKTDDDKSTEFWNKKEIIYVSGSIEKNDTDKINLISNLSKINMEKIFLDMDKNYIEPFQILNDKNIANNTSGGSVINNENEKENLSNENMKEKNIINECNKPKKDNNEKINMENKSLDEIYEYINKDNKTKNKKKYKKRNGKNKGKSKKIQKNKNEEDNLEIEDNNVDDPIVLQFKNDINEKVIFANTITKIKPSISENWIKTISSC